MREVLSEKMKLASFHKSVTVFAFMIKKDYYYRTLVQLTLVFCTSDWEKCRIWVQIVGKGGTWTWAWDPILVVRLQWWCMSACACISI